MTGVQTCALPIYPMIVPRAVVVVEAMTALTLVDLIFDNMTARMDRVKEFYRK